MSVGNSPGTREAQALANSTGGLSTANTTVSTNANVSTDPLFESPATLDVFSLGRRAANERNRRFGATASFVRARQWLTTGTWRGPRDASESYGDIGDLSEVAEPASLDGVSAAAFTAATSAGVGLWVGTPAPELARTIAATGARVLLRFPFRSGEPAGDRRARLAALKNTLDSGTPYWGVMPSPIGEAEGIDTLRVVAALRLDVPQIAHVVLDVALLGPRLAQMALGFGGDELWAPIVSERALRLGGNANNPSMTRKEACILIRGAGLTPRERTGPDSYTEEPA